MLGAFGDLTLIERNRAGPEAEEPLACWSRRRIDQDCASDALLGFRQQAAQHPELRDMAGNANQQVVLSSRERPIQSGTEVVELDYLLPHPGLRTRSKRQVVERLSQPGEVG